MNDDGEDWDPEEIALMQAAEQKKQGIMERSLQMQKEED